MSENKKSKPKLVVAVSSRSLFDLEDENKIFESEGVEAFRRFQEANSNVPAAPGVAFPLVRKLLALNTEGEPPLVEVSVVSKNDPSCGMRILRSCKHHGLAVERGIFTGGGPRTKYLSMLGAHLFLSASKDDARRSLEVGVPAACVGAGPMKDSEDDVIRIAFDGDSVLFSDESERIYKTEGLHAFRHNETVNADKPLPPGPMHAFLMAMNTLRTEHPELRDKFRIALVTARGMEAAERAMHTLNSWKTEVDEAFFLSGATKADFLAEFGADFFFDDQKKHIDLANEKVASGHVVWGVANEQQEVPADTASAERGVLSEVAQATPRRSVKPR